jgi:hypothetical protein
MRTTLHIDDDVLRAAQELARREKKTVDRIISELARTASGLDFGPFRPGAAASRTN